VENINDLDVDVGGAGTSVGTGGMVTKLTAARIACAAGCKTIVCLSANLERDIEKAVVEGASVGTAFLPAKEGARGKKKWLLAVPVRGRVVVGVKGAKAVLRGAPLLLMHVVDVAEGEFRVQECVAIEDEDGNELARGLCNYASADVAGEKRREDGEARRDGEEAWEDDLDGPMELMHANNICVTNVETLRRSFTFTDISQGYDSSAVSEDGAEHA
jgi:glutamate 5-kinase